MSKAAEPPSTLRRDTHQTIRDYRAATGCSRLRATIHWVCVCILIAVDVAQKDAEISPAETIELVNFVLEYEALESDLAGEAR